MRTKMKNRIGSAMLLICLIVLGGCGGSSAPPSAPPGGVVGPPPPPPAPPLIPVNDAFNWTGNTRLTVVAANGLLANDPAGTVISTADAVTSQGGAVSVNLATGAFTYDPPLGLQNVNDTFTYRVAGALQATVTVTLAERVWYVRNNDPGADRGHDRAPFLTLAQAEAASDASDTIFVFAGNLTAAGQNAGITLKPGQRLLGEGVGLTVNGVPLVDPVPNAVLSNAGLTLPAGNTPVVRLATGNEVAGFSIQAAFNEAILAPGGTGHNLHDNAITFDAANGREGIRLLAITGNNFVTDNIITGSPRNGIKLVNNEDQDGNVVAATPVAATVTMSRNTLRDSAQDGIRVILDGTGTDMQLHILTNTIANSGTAGGNGGIDIAGLGTASLTAAITRNTVAGSAAQAIDLTAGGVSTLTAFAANNTLSASGAATDLRAAIPGGSTATLQLEMITNINAAANSTIQVENNAGISGTFRFFEAGNDTLALRVGPITNAAQGSLGIVFNGVALFEANCSQCHLGNGLGRGRVGPNLTNATVEMINFQLLFNPTMSFIKLTQGEIQAIAAALATVP